MAVRRNGKILSLVLLCLVALIFLSVATAVSTMPATAAEWDGTATTWTQGGGSVDNPFILENASHLAFLAQQTAEGNDYNGTYFKIADGVGEIDLSNDGAFSWTPIGFVGYDGSSATSISPFNGNFNGNGAVLKNLSVAGDIYMAGLFGYIGEHAAVYGFSVDGALDLVGIAAAGAIAGRNDGEIYDINVLCEVSISGTEEKGTRVGGIVGENYGSVSNVNVTSVTIDTAETAGGVVGENWGNINNVIIGEEVTLSITADRVGGIAGASYKEISLTAFYGALNATSSYVGGIAADNDQDGLIEYSVNIGRVTVNSEEALVGGIASQNNGSISGCYYVCDNPLDNYDSMIFGGIAGGNGGAISDSFVKGKAYGTIVGGITGTNSGTIERVLFVGVTDESGYGLGGVEEGIFGGIVGINTSLSATISSAITFTNYPSYGAVGAIIGEGEADISNSYYNGGSLFAPTADGVIATDGDFLSSDDFELTGFTQRSGSLPVLDIFSAYDGDALEGLTDRFSTDMTDAVTLGNRIEVTLDGALYPVYGDMAIHLPLLQSDGFIHTEWELDGDTVFNPLSMVKFSERTSLTAVWTIEEITLVSQNYTDGIIEVYDDDAEYILSAVFSHALTITYEWYYSSELSEVYESFAVMPGVTDGSLTVKDVLDSGYYYVKATVSGKATSSAEEMTTSLRSGIFSVSILPTTYSGITHDELSGDDYIYDPNKTLADFVLNENFHWVDAGIVPDCATTTYRAYYWEGDYNYEPYELDITIILNKATYVQGDVPTHAVIDAGRYMGVTLSYYSTLLSPYFRWENGDYVPVPTDGATYYSAYYNADPTNYEDCSVTIGFILRKGEATSNTYRSEFSGSYDPNKTLADYIFTEENFYWVNPGIVPDCATRSYRAYYCLDDVRYERFEFDVNVNISKAVPSVSVTVSHRSVYYEEEALPSISVESSDISGTVVWETDVLLLGRHSYKWIFTPDTEYVVNYSTAEGYVSVNALAIAITELAVSGTYKDSYVAFETFDTDNLIVELVYNSGRRDVLTADLYTVVYPDERDYFLFGDESVTLVYAEDSAITCIVSVNVGKVVVAEPTASNSPTGDNKFTFNLQDVTPDLPTSILYDMRGDLTARNVGNYEIEITLADPVNYRWQTTAGAVYTFSWEITVRYLEVPTVSNVYRFTGRVITCSEISATQYYNVAGNSGYYVGPYDITLSLLDKVNTAWESGSTDNQIVQWHIRPKLVNAPIPVDKTYVYNGSGIAFEYTGADVEITDGGIYTNAGRYTVYFDLADKDNFVWNNDGEEGGTDTKSFPFVIEKKSITVPNPTVTEFVYDGTAIELPVETESTVFEVVNYIYTSVGDYEAKVTLRDPNNYRWEGKSDDTITVTIPWSIVPRRIGRPQVGNMPTYTGSNLKAPVTESDYYVITGDTVKTLATDGLTYTATVSLIDPDNTCWQDGGVENIVIEWGILRRTITSPTGGGTLTYNGAEQRIRVVVDSGCLVTGDRATIAGDYNVTVKLPDADNYIWDDNTTAPKTIEWTIDPMKVTRPQVRGDSVYRAGGVTANISTSVYYTVTNNRAVNVGQYFATVSLNDKHNYAWDNMATADLILPWNIVRAPVTVPKIDVNLIYSGIAQTIGLSGTDYYTVTGITGTAAGEYQAVLTLTDPTNHSWDDGTTAPKIIVWHIRKLTLDAGADVELPDTYIAGSTLPTPSKSGYYFDGWYLTPDFSGEKITSITELTADTTLYAKWVASGLNSPDDVVVNKGGDRGGLSTMAIVGIIILGVSAVIAVLIIILVFTTRGKKRIY